MPISFQVPTMELCFMSKVNYHMGNRLNAILEEVGVNKTRLSEQIGYSKKHIFKILERDEIQWSVIRKIGDAIRVDMNTYFPELPPEPLDIHERLDKMELTDVNRVKAMLKVMEQKYMDLMEKYTALLEQQTKQ